MKKSTAISLFSLTSLAGIFSAMQAYITLAAKKATRTNYLKTEGGQFFDWSFGKVYYSKKGKGSPILLIHDVEPSDSSVEWIFLRGELVKDHTVYMIDLPGCGRSDKPAIQYTPYLYVSLLEAFTKKVIKEPTVVVASHRSASFTMAAAASYPEAFLGVYLINPVSPKTSNPDNLIPHKTKLQMRASLFFGDFAYRSLYTAKYIHRQFREVYYHDGRHVSGKLEEIWYESAHSQKGHGRYLLASIRSNYMEFDCTRFLNDFPLPVTVIFSEGISAYEEVASDYGFQNPDFVVKGIAASGLFPQMEHAASLSALLSE